VTESYKPHRPTAKRLFQQVGSRYALSNQVLLLFLIPAYGVGLVFDVTRIESTFEYRLLSSTIGYLATITPLLIARIFLPNKPRKSRPALIMAIFMLAGLIRGAVLLEFSVLSGQFQEGELLYRLVGGPLFTLIALILNAILASNFSRHKEALVLLAADRLRLQVRSAGVLARVQQQQEQLAAKVETLIRPAIKRIQETFNSDSSALVVSSLRDAADEVVRPLSKAVAEIVPLTYAFPLSAFFALKPLLDMQSTNSQIWTMIIFELSLGLFLFFAQLVQLQRKETTQRLEEVNRQLEVISSRLSQELWLNRKRMAALLHGPVQASLYAAAMGMAQTANPSAEYISKAQKEIETALDQLSNPDRLESETLMSVMNQVKDLWSDSVEIQISIPNDLEAAISQEPLTLDATIEIARELVTNSVKHGKASKIEVQFSYLKDGNFSVEVLDNGTAFSESSNPGYGTKVLTELSLKWERTRSGDTTRSYAEMVLGRDSV